VEGWRIWERPFTKEFILASSRLLIMTLAITSIEPSTSSASLDAAEVEGLTQSLMREIKFRAWDKDHGKMRVPGTFAFYVGSSNGLAYDGHRNLYDGFSLMQFTGLHDKNGKPIYERDVVREDHGILEELILGPDRIAEVKWGTDGWVLGLEEVRPLLASGWKFFEVIGNIYETPELLV
jgi:uncharacterized phage protein (TIGR01671 family)